jgi:hypothetical protein
VEASENKTDRKLDILSRTIPTPGPMRRREETPDGDTSMEQSFESAEQSLSVSEDASFDQGSDPFIMPSKAAPRHAVQDAEDEDEDGSDTASEDEDEDDEEAVNATLSPRHRRDTVRPTPALADVSMESEDPLAAMDHLNVSRDEAGSSDLTDEEGISGEGEDEDEGSEEDEDDEEEEEEEELEEDDEEVADDEDEGEAGESSFATSNATSDTASDSASDSDVYSERGRGGRDSDESAVGRGATQRRKSGSPIKKSRPSVPSSSKAKPKSTTVRSTKKVISPLQERRAQDVIEISDDEVVAVKTPQKKRYVRLNLVCSILIIRVLGKKVMTEDEMIAADSKVGTGVAEVRRMMRGSGQFTPSRFAT